MIFILENILFPYSQSFSYSEGLLNSYKESVEYLELVFYEIKICNYKSVIINHRGIV